MGVAVEYSPELATRLETAVEAIQRTASSDRLQRPLSHWVLPSEKHLPQQLLAKKLGDILTLTFDNLAEMPTIGNLKIEKIIGVIERAANGDPPADSGASNLIRFERIKQRTSGPTEQSVIVRPLRGYLHIGDRHFPQAFIDKTVGEVLDLGYEGIYNSPGLGEKRFELLLQILERATEPYQAACHGAEQVFAIQTPQSGMLSLGFENWSEADWRAYRELAKVNDLGGCPLGRFPESLSDLAQSLWETPLSVYLDRTIREVHDMPGHGPARVSQVFKVFSRLGCLTPRHSLPNAPSIRLCHPLVKAMSDWIEQNLTVRAVADPEPIRDRLIEPMLKLIEIDLGGDAATMSRERLGVEGRPLTLEQIAERVGLTRERVRQITMKVGDVLRVRWPEGRYLVRGLCDLTQASPNCDRQFDLLRRVMVVCFVTDAERGGTRDDAREAFERAGRAKRTPMTVSELHSWAAGEFPDLRPCDVRDWLEEAGYRHGSLFFSSDPMDRLLLHMNEASRPLLVKEVAAIVEGDERSFRLRIDRDPRFVEEDSKAMALAENHSLLREGTHWDLRLESTSTEGPRDIQIGVSELAHLIVGGFTTAGIADATVWGVHRFTCKIVEQSIGARLPASLTPFILARLLVLHSDGRLRHMRRRRLRWDAPGSALAAKGKRGWVNQVVTAAAKPMTFDELDGALRKHYQDYEDYVLKQLHMSQPEENEEGVAESEYLYVPGVSVVIPAMVLPKGWRLNDQADNVSEGTRRAVAKVASIAGRRGIPRRSFDAVPWMIPLCEKITGAPLRWLESLPSDADPEVVVSSSRQSLFEDFDVQSQ